MTDQRTDPFAQYDDGKEDFFDEVHRFTPLSEGPKFRDLVVLKREEVTGRFLTNVPHVVFYHVDFDDEEPYTWGYLSRGPTELAINIAELCLLDRMPEIQHNAFEFLSASVCSVEAVAIHQDLKERFVAKLDKDKDHEIPYAAVAALVSELVAEHLDEIREVQGQITEFQ